MRGRAHGGRHRRRFDLRITAAVLAAVVVLVLTLGYANGTLATGSAGAAAGRGGGGVPTPIAAPPSSGASGRAPVAATAAGTLELLARLLPPNGRVTNVRRDFPDVDGPDVHLTFDRAGVRSYVSLLVLDGDSPSAAGQRCDSPAYSKYRCSTLPNGAVMLLYGDSNCSGGDQVVVHRLDGVSVGVTRADCSAAEYPTYSGSPTPITSSAPLGSPRHRSAPAHSSGPASGSGSAPVGGPDRARSLLTISEMQLVAADEQWNVVLPAEIVEAGRRHYPDIPVLTYRTPNNTRTA